MIEIGSKWQDKDGNLCEVIDTCIYENSSSSKLTYEFKAIDYVDTNGIVHISTKKDFLNSFKPYEPVYEYQWLVRKKHTNIWCEIWGYKTEERARQILDCSYELYCLDFTKRERK